MSKSDRPVFCFIHMERAGGTTLHAVLRNNYPLSYCSLTAWHLWSNEPGHELSPDEARGLVRWLPHTRGFGGHTTRSYLGYEGAIGRPVQYFTFIRDPLKRYFSHFNYQRERKGIPWTIDEYLDEPRFNNYMTRRIAGTFDAALARRRLREDFAFAGLTDRFDESLLLLKDQLRLDRFVTLYERENASRDPNYRKDPRLDSDEVRQRAQQNNALDIELHRYVVEVLFPGYVAAYRGDFERDLAEHRRLCEGYRFSPFKRAAWLAYRHLGYRHLERLLFRRYGGAWRQQQAGTGTHRPQHERAAES